MKRSTQSPAAARLATLRLQLAQLNAAIDALQTLDQLRRARVVSIDQVRQATLRPSRLPAAA